MKRASVIVVILSLLALAPGAAAARTNAAAGRAWRPFFKAFRDAARRRDREALKQLMVPDFFTTGGGVDGEARDGAFAFWDEPNARGWEALERTLAKGTAPYTYMRDPRDEKPKRVAPPAANARRSIARGDFGWYAIFEFREDGRWYCAVFAQCCD
ncbi:MAG TPA: hypothetical protein VF611_20440 [Pyrinomonadaceae bacterium]|jgi:hypothetical protein